MKTFFANDPDHPERPASWKENGLVVEYFLQFSGRKRMMIMLLIIGFKHLILLQFSGGEEEEEEVAVDGRGLQDLHTW